MGTFPNLPSPPVEQAGHHGDVVGHRFVRKQPRFLNDVAHAPPQFVRHLLSDIDAVDLDQARIGLDQPVHEPERGRFATARRTQ